LRNTTSEATFTGRASGSIPSASEGETFSPTPRRVTHDPARSSPSPEGTLASSEASALEADEEVVGAAVDLAVLDLDIATARVRGDARTVDALRAERPTFVDRVHAARDGDAGPLR
jgi:hypothetical protein